ncbi:lipocalin family protein [Mucilaginibacter ginsenosidivorax]|uniref:Lipocalin family protein n=1 Tax=Mucilaginibacter ginsenosidivorax TaxID=862126 RepID=A0A5B8VXZ4_9SPHI|nr:lipocalin family protein [Mucilaginibacter ginsenosidivorax]QEC76111.1 lipocalin family protein [Mucilaginibacter ginsenosidivorax]
MKTKLTLIKTLGLLAVVLAFTFSACKKDAGGNIDITGKWAILQFQGIQQYEFKNGNQFQYDIIATDSVTKKIIGYRFRVTGKYSIKNDSLMMFDQVNYSNSKNSYGPVTELIPVSASKTVAYGLSVNSKKNKLSLYFTCPPNADCVPSPMVFSKQ